MRFFTMEHYYSSLTEVIFRNYKIDVSWSGFSDVDTQWNQTNMSAPFSRLYYVYNGSGTIKTNGIEHKLLPGNMYLIPSGVRYSYYCEEHFAHLFFHLNMNTMIDYDFLTKSGFAQKQVSVGKLNSLLSLYKSNEFIDQLILKSIIYKDIAELLALQDKPIAFDATLSPIVTDAIQYIKSNLSIQLTADEICDAIHVFKTTLLRKFRNEIGMPLGQYIDKLIFFEATNKLANTTLSIKEISDELGFCDQFYFSQRFRHMIGFTPTTYRKQAKIMPIKQKRTP